MIKELLDVVSEIPTPDALIQQIIYGCWPLNKDIEIGQLSLLWLTTKNNKIERGNCHRWV